MARLAAWATLALAMVFASPAYAHKLKVFATAVGAEIEGNVYFVGSGPAPGAKVSIDIGDGSPLTPLLTDAEGKFRFTAVRRADHVISVDTGDGHSAQTIVAADDLPSSLPSSTNAGSAAASATLVAATAPRAALFATTTDEAALEDLVTKAVAQQIRPLREQLNAYEDQVRLRDIVGGIGYIVGLAGLAMWLRRRQQDRLA